MNGPGRRRHADPAYPAWIREIDLALPVKPQFLVTGNLRDVHVLPETDPRSPRFPSTVDVLLDVLRENGYEVVLRYDPIDGLEVLHEGTPGGASLLQRGLRPGEGALLTVDQLRELVQRVVRHPEQRVAMVLDYASRLRADDHGPDRELLALLATAEKLAYTARARTAAGSPRRVPLYNPLLWLVDREVDLPHWLSAIDAVRVVSVPLPTLGTRLAAATRLIPSLPGAGPAGEEGRAAAADRYAAATDGMTIRELVEVKQVAIDGDVPVGRVDQAVRSLRVGLFDNPWREEALRERIRSATGGLGEQVLGQPKAVRKALDILIRAAMGLSGAQSGGHPGRPQGILFFAGPTGVGKTELAKALATVLFASEEAYTRFDMSEFSAEQSEARLIGAPPGYIGHDAGGELTNAVRQRPFSLLLFDEVEKAHPLILDKFLQILEDGRLTDGSGSTVHFSETVIVFTSNLGVYRRTETGDRVPVIRPGEPYESLETKLRAAIDEHFTKEIGRPELLNRIGDNIVVFDYISEPVARRLIDRYVANVLERVRSTLGITVTIRPQQMERLRLIALEGLPFGGRGLGARIETALVNPLARELFAVRAGTGAVEVVALHDDADGRRIELV